MTRRNSRDLCIALSTAAILLALSAMATLLIARASAFAEVLTATSTAALAVTAVYGIVAWHRQISAPHQYETACQLYAKVVTLRRVVKDVRQPADSNLLEMAYTVIRDDPRLPCPFSSYGEMLRTVYKKRQIDLQEALEPLQGELPSVEAVLGMELADQLRAALKKCSEVLSLLAACAVSKSKEADPATSLEPDDRAILVEASDPDADAFGSEVHALLSRILEGIARFK
jgi:hypothetical protein